LLWVYYSSIILYFGAAFTKVFAQYRGRNIYPNDYAVWIQQVDMETTNASMPQQANRLPS
jgi:membrane protein